MANFVFRKHITGKLTALIKNLHQSALSRIRSNIAQACNKPLA
ncbi:hypothetical protein UUU_39090 [Klebsiella pneumoniae subsp. pneumoniae DSM 30104 = JCM 1662 = NBRC 14940]|nr:hypothetical protein UUU_39090 [Klebsiella pneumoniae subsp. pneumoniae DSM 30104 = JCM 1662 = NBRC 14940]